MPICLSCSEHRHSYVRKNAVFAIYTIYTIYHGFENFILDASELIQTFLIAESDATRKRNAFVFLSNCAMPKAVEYILRYIPQHFEQIPDMEEPLQTSIIEVIKLDRKRDSIHRVREPSILAILPVLTPTTTAAIHPSDF
jgi:coatomer subunit beta